jgi:hypothetical protein
VDNESHFRNAVVRALTEIQETSETSVNTVTGSVTFASGETNDQVLGDYLQVLLATANSDDTSAISGFQDGSDGRKLYLFNVSSYDLTLNNQDVSSTASNRIITGTGDNLIIPADNAALLVYDISSSRWRVCAATAGSTLTLVKQDGVTEYTTNKLHVDLYGGLNFQYDTPNTWYEIYYVPGDHVQVGTSFANTTPVSGSIWVDTS